MNKLKDVRENEDYDIGNIIVSKGDHSMGFFTTDKGYILILDSYNMHTISKYFKSSNKEANNGR